MLQLEGESSGYLAHQESSLTQVLRKITQVFQTLDQNSHQSTIRLDAVLAAITASNENAAHIGQLLVQNEQPYGGPQRPQPC